MEDILVAWMPAPAGVSKQGKRWYQASAMASVAHPVSVSVVHLIQMSVNPSVGKLIDLF